MVYAVVGTIINCYCCSNKAYSDCCERFILGFRHPDTAETLMRSRYTAYNLCDGSYLQKTSAENAKKQSMERITPIDWMRLKICNIQNGESVDETGAVEFKAFYKENGKICCLHEVSQFKKLGGLWFYVGGVIV
jgi:SEC-C motif domain protein